jgi:hypothetical protein
MTSPATATSPQASSWADELGTYLSPRSFPASPDHLAATLIKRHAPSHLLWRLSVAPRTREFRSLDELVEHLVVAATSAPVASFGDPT